MAGVRGTVLFNTIAFLRARYGPDAHERVLDSVPPECAASFQGPLTEGGLRPLVHLLTYMEKAKALCGPSDPDFFRQMGLFAGAKHRDDSNFSFMLSDRETAQRMLKVIWRSFFDEGYAEPVEKTQRSFTFRVVGFRGSSSLCERLVGAAQAQLRGVGAEHRACVFRGDPHCEFSVWWAE